MAEGTILDLSFEELAGLISGLGLPRYRARQIWHAVYRELSPSYEEMTTLPRDLRAELPELLPFPAAETIAATASEDGQTLKRLIRQQIENPLAKRILTGDFAPGDHIEVDAAGEAYEFGKRVEAEVV